ncbi:hypothetical protein H4R33_007118 [Dimargaris cristalligena]|nr:hypothetical protein H4R33_007118 [Dimargaris cristalligena]
MASIHTIKLHKVAIISTWDISLDHLVQPTEKPPIWWVEQLIDHLANLPDNDALLWHRLCQKVLTILCLTTMWRPRSDFARVTLDSVTFHQESDQPEVMMITAYHAKEGKRKSINIQALEDSSRLCPVRNTRFYINKPYTFRQPKEQALFITKHGHMASEDTLGN